MLYRIYLTKLKLCDVFKSCLFLARNRLEEGLLKIIHKCRDGDVDSLPIKLPTLRSLKIGPLHFDYDE